MIVCGSLAAIGSQQKLVQLVDMAIGQRSLRAAGRAWRKKKRIKYRSRLASSALSYQRSDTLMCFP